MKSNEFLFWSFMIVYLLGSICSGALLAHTYGIIDLAKLWEQAKARVKKFF